MKARLILPVLVLAVAGCGSSSGSIAPAPTGMLTPTGAEGAADTAICANVSSDGSPDASGIDQQAASPDLLALWQAWRQDYAKMSNGALSAAAVAAEAGYAAAWCSAHGYS